MDWKSRFYAMSIHTLLSCVLLGVALYLVYFIWYPAPLHKAMGVGEIFWILLSIDLILGPILTFIIFNKNKKELKRDIFIVILLQISAYLYGLHTVAQGRPVWQVFVVDDIELVRSIDIIGDHSEYKTSFFKKPSWVAANYSNDAEIAKKQKEMEMFEGISLAVQVDTYQPLENRKEKISERLKKIEELQKFNLKQEVNTSIKIYSDKNIAGYLPVKGFAEDMTALFDHDGKPIAIVDLRPWN